MTEPKQFPEHGRRDCRPDTPCCEPCREEYECHQDWAAEFKCPTHNPAVPKEEVVMVYADIWLCGKCMIVNDMGYCTTCQKPKAEVYRLELCHTCKVNVSLGHLYCNRCGNIFCSPCRDHDRRMHEATP